MDSLTKLLADYGRAPVLSHEAQLHLARQVRGWLDWEPIEEVPEIVRRRGIRAKQRLIETNLRLVVTVAKKFKRATNNNDEEFQDLIQMGILGLNRGVEKFDPTRGYAPSTYFFHWIHQGVSRSASSVTSLIYIPESASARFRLLSRLVGVWEARYGHRPDIETLQRLSGLSRVMIENTIVVGRAKNVKSLDQTAVDGGDTCLVDLQSDSEAWSPDDHALMEEQSQLAATILKALPDADRELLERVFMHDDGRKAIADELGISRSGVGYRRDAALGRAREIAQQVAV